jgi:hypothetical protein
MAPSITTIVIMPVAWMIVVEAFVQVSQRTMVGTVLSSAVEALLMRALMGVGEILVKPPVIRVIAVIVVRKSRRHGRGQQRDCRRSKDISDCHDTSPSLRARRQGSDGTFHGCSFGRTSLNAAARLALGAVHRRAGIVALHSTR